MANFVPLGPLDDYALAQYIRHQRGYSTAIVFGGALNSRFADGNDQKAKSILIKAAQRLLSQDRMLSVVPVEKEKPHWAGIKDCLDMESIVSIDRCTKSFTSINSRIEYIYSRYSSGQFDIEGKPSPLWKLVLNRGYENEQDVLVLVISHMIADGCSARRVFLQVLDAIQDLEKNDDNTSVLINDDGTFPIQHSTTRILSIKDVYNPRPSLSNIIQVHVTMFMFKLSKYFPKGISRLLPFDRPYYSRGNEKLTNFKPSPEMGSRVTIIPSLYEATKAPGLGFPVSVNSILSRLITTATFETCSHFNKLSSPDNPKTDRKIKIQTVSATAMSLESPNKPKVENFFGFFDYAEKLDADTVFWDSVKNYHYQIRNVPRINTFIMFYATCYVGAFTRLLSALQTQTNLLMQTICQTYLSNVGLLYLNGNQKHVGSASISNVFLFFPLQPFPAPLATFAVSLDKTSETMLSFAWRKDSVSDEWIDYFETVLRRSAKKIADRAEKPDLSMTIESLVSSKT